MNQLAAALIDSNGESPEAFVRRFLTAYRAWEIESTRRHDKDRAEEARLEKLGESAELPEYSIDAIQADYEKLIRTFATQRIVDQDIGASWADPPKANVKKTKFVGTERARSGVIVRTIEKYHSMISPEDFEYVLKQIADAWRLDDRRSRDLDGRWIHRIF